MLDGLCQAPGWVCLTWEDYHRVIRSQDPRLPPSSVCSGALGISCLPTDKHEGKQVQQCSRLGARRNPLRASGALPTPS